MRPELTVHRFHLRAEEHTPLLGPLGMDIFFLINCLNVVLCLCCATQRRRALRASLRPMDPRWAALTFPLASTGSVSFFYANEYSLRSSELMPWTGHVSAAWSYVLVPLTLVLVPCTV